MKYFKNVIVVDALYELLKSNSFYPLNRLPFRDKYFDNSFHMLRGEYLPIFARQRALAQTQ
jgi:hypothetical protein